MSDLFPTRSDSHQMQELSERFFRNALPRNWTCEKPLHDYGVDLRVELFEGRAATGLELLVQLKSSTKPSTGGETESVRLKTATYNHLWGKLQVAMLVKYVAEEDEAYWLLFRDIPTPPEGQKTFSVHIPRLHRLSSIEWADVQAYVRSVTDTKLAAARRRAARAGLRE